jgi:two-component sensor histidine kinase
MRSNEVSIVLNEIGARIAAVGHLHRNLAVRPEGLEFDLNQHLWNLCEGLIAALAQAGQFELLPSATGPCAIGTDKVLSVSLIVTEIVTNSLKYAHPAGVPGRIWLGCHRQADGSVIVEVADDGVGLPEGFDPEADGSLGSQTVALLAEKLEAKVMIVPRPIGLCLRLCLPPSTGQ